MNSEYLASAPSSSAQVDETFLSLLLNVVARNLRMLRGGRFLLDGNPKGGEVAEHIATKFEVNT